MYEQFVYDSAVAQFKSQAIGRNDNERAAWINRRDDWLTNAALHLALNLPLPARPAPPARTMKVTAPPAGSTADQDRIMVEFGPELVADPACELPAVAVPNLPPDFMHVRRYEGWGDTWSAEADDTVKHGKTVDYIDPVRGAVKLQKVACPGFGGIPMNFYLLAGSR